MDRGRAFIGRWKSDYDLRTFLAGAGSLAVTAVFALYNGFLGIRHASLWHGSVCVYYLVLALLRGLVIAAARRAYRSGDRGRVRERAALAASVLLLLLNLSLVVPVSMMVTLRMPVRMSLIHAIAMAAHTACKVAAASVNLRKCRASRDALVRLLRTVGFVDALVSVLALQNTLIMVVEGGGDTALLPVTASVGAAVLIAVLALSAAEIAAGIRRLRAGDRA